MTYFKIKIADVVFLVSSNYSSTRDYYRKFFYDGPADHIINVHMDEVLQLYDNAHHLDLERCERGVLKAMLDKTLVKYNVFPIHASAISFKDYAYVFTGLSGVGKSTHSMLWKQTFGDEVIIINDDRPYLKVSEREALAYSHPQSGIQNVYTNTFSQVKMIGKIIRDNNNYVVPMSRSSFFPFLVQQTFTMDEPSITSKIILLLKQVLQHVDLFEIHCNKNTNAAFLIQKQLSEFID